MSEGRSIQYQGFGISFELLLSHIFPGSILLISILISTDIIDLSIIRKIPNIIMTNQQFILIILLSFILSTFFGFLIDLLSYFTFRIFARKYINKYRKDIVIEYNIFNIIKTNDDLAIYKHFFEDRTYIIDAYSNLALSMLFGCYAIIKLLVWLNCSSFIILLLMCFYIILIILLYYISLKLIISFFANIKDLIEDRLKKISIEYLE
jgi:hypothetical protein